MVYLANLILETLGACIEYLCVQYGLYSPVLLVSTIKGQLNKY
jgi:hypothetical protein